LTLRTIPTDFAKEPLAAIDARLTAIVEEQDVAIPLAIESGSRAWDFPSPDSDYDCRFFFVRKTDAYLSPWPSRDVIETPLVDDLDLNGWDLGKALKLLLKGNAVVIEWLTSPIVYRGDARFREELLAFAKAHADAERIARHYLHLGEKQRRTYFADGKPIKLKKIFYALRPAAALRWLGRHDAAVAPMHFPTLMAQCDPPTEVRALVDELIARKAVTRELGEAPLPKPIERFIDEEFDRARRLLPARAHAVPAGAKAEAEVLFRTWVQRLA